MPEIFETLNMEVFRPFLESLSPNSIEYLGQMESLQETHWQELSPTERLDALNSLEARLAEIQGRDPCEVTAKFLSNGCYGYYDGQITIETQLIEGPQHRMDAINTIAHEGRHAYQRSAIEHPGFHLNEAERQSWANNMSNYLYAQQFGMELYLSQPVEVDARQYANQISAHFV